MIPAARRLPGSYGLPDFDSAAYRAREIARLSAMAAIGPLSAMETMELLIVRDCGPERNVPFNFESAEDQI